MSIAAYCCAAGATWGECQRPRRSRRCPLVGFLREIRSSFWGQLLRGFATGIWHLAVQNTVPAELEIGQISCVCVFVCLSVLFFCQPLFRAGRWTYGSVFRKNRSKNGVPHRMRRRDGPFSGSAPIRLIRGRWHSPQVAPAAPPAPRVHSSIKEKMCARRRRENFGAIDLPGWIFLWKILTEALPKHDFPEGKSTLAGILLKKFRACGAKKIFYLALQNA